MAGAVCSMEFKLTELNIKIIIKEKHFFLKKQMFESNRYLYLYAEAKCNAFLYIFRQWLRYELKDRIDRRQKHLTIYVIYISN